MDDLLQDFLAETRESLDEVDNELVLFEQNPNDDARLASIFRLVHTIKGTCGFLGLPRLEALSHAAETLMGNYRDGAEISDRGVSAILTAIDRLKEIVHGLATSGGAEPAGSDQDLIDELNALSDPTALEKDPDPEDLAAARAMASPPEVERETLPGEVSLEQLEQAFLDAAGPEQFSNASAAAEFAEMAARELEAAAAKPDVSPDKVIDPAATESPAQQLIRVNIQTLEELMTMVSELVLTRNQLLETGKIIEAGPLSAPLQRLSNVTAELQQTVMKTRMQPISTAWKKLPRIVRDLSRSVGKDIELVMSGEDTELDRQVLELIQDPLTHMVRNSADHGLETAEERLCLGKPGRGTIRLSAAHKGGFIVVEIADDGRGLPLERIKQKAIDNGLMTAAEVATFTDQQLFSLIFQPGFSTAREITSVSGRGVGMDVVRNNLEMIGGAIAVESSPGEGTKFTIKIPLTLAIVSALLVEAGRQRYAVPQNAVVEMIRLGGNSDHRIEQVNGSLLLRRRGELLPVACLSGLLTPSDQSEIDAADLQTGFVVILKVGPLQFGLIVDAVFHSEEIVVKPLSAKLADIPFYSGNTILGDGNVVLILDPHGFADLLGDSVQLTSPQAVMPEIKKSTSESETAMLLFQAGAAEPLAVPLTLVARIEDIPAEKLEHVDGRIAVQYRGELMPLIFAPGASEQVDVARTVLVFADSGRTMGLVIDRVVDIVESKMTLDLASDQPGVLGTAVIKGKATAILDVGHFLPLAFADWFRRRTVNADNQTQRLLLVDDSSFFLNMLTPVLTAAGFDVTAADNALAALELLKERPAFDVIVSDVEMPRVTGLEFVAELRKLDGYDQVPAIALSATCTPRSVDRGLAAGFDDFIAKFDRAGLIDVLHGLGPAGGRLAA